MKIKVYKSEQLYWIDDGCDAIDFNTLQEVADYIWRFLKGYTVEWNIQ